jgi:hypothetical protein
MGSGARLLDVQVEARPRSLQQVRCLACHVVYDLPVDAGGHADAGCPECGAVVWLAATIPPAKSDLAEHP